MSIRCLIFGHHWYAIRILGWDGKVQIIARVCTKCDKRQDLRRRS